MIHKQSVDEKWVVEIGGDGRGGCAEAGRCRIRETEQPQIRESDHFTQTAESSLQLHLWFGSSGMWPPEADSS